MSETQLRGSRTGQHSWSAGSRKECSENNTEKGVWDNIMENLKHQTAQFAFLMSIITPQPIPNTFTAYRSISRNQQANPKVSKHYKKVERKGGVFHLFED